MPNGSNFDIIIVGSGAGGGTLAHRLAPSGKRILLLERGDVIVKRNAATERYSADIVVLACGAINSAVVLLRSASNKNPTGLGNRSDVVGRHYMGHTNSVQMAISKTPNPTVFQKTLSVNDFYLASNESPYPMGHISFVGKLDADTLRGGAPRLTPGFTLEAMATHSLDFWLTTEDLPDPGNRVTLNREGEIVLSYRPNNEQAHRNLIGRLDDMKANTTIIRVYSAKIYIDSRSGSHWQSRRGVILIAVIVAIVLWWLFRPEALFINRQVSDRAPADVADIQPLFTGRLSTIRTAASTTGRVNVFKNVAGFQLQISDLESQANGPFTVSLAAAENDQHPAKIGSDLSGRAREADSCRRPESRRSSCRLPNGSFQSGGGKRYPPAFLILRVPFVGPRLADIMGFG